MNNMFFYLKIESLSKLVFSSVDYVLCDKSCIADVVSNVRITQLIFCILFM